MDVFVTGWNGANSQKMQDPTKKGRAHNGPSVYDCTNEEEHLVFVFFPSGVLSSLKGVSVFGCLHAVI